MKKTLEVLNQLITEKVIDGFAIGGAVAAFFYTEPAETADLDIFITFPPDKLIVSLEPIYDAIREKGYQEWEKEGIIIEGIPVQFLPAESPLLIEAYNSSQEQKILEIGVKIVTFEHLCAIMLETGRPKDKLRLLDCISSPNFSEKKFLKICKKNNLIKRWTKFYETFLINPS